MNSRLVTAGACGVFAWVVLNTAWLCDDAYITLRTIDNFVNGHGLRWNVVERVQGFTHPAWLFLVTPFYALTREAYYTVLVVQAMLSVATVMLLCRAVAITWGHACFAVAVFISSKALVDFSTGGLENPLTHCLLVLLFLNIRHARSDAGPGRITWMFALATLVTLSRQDLILLVLPALWPWVRFRHWRSALVGSAPAIVWYLFSLVYYGQVVPNTALAKLSTGIPWTELVPQGLRYWYATASIDPLTPLVLGLGALVLATSRVPLARRIALGGLVYSAYVIWVGGDFMSGRFLTAPLVWILVGLVGLIGRWRWWNSAPRVAAAAVAVVAAGLLTLDTAPLLSGRQFGAVPLPDDEFAIAGVVDERRFSFPSMGLLHRWSQGGEAPLNPWAEAGLSVRRRVEATGKREVIPANNVGLFGYWAGPHVHIVDRYGLTDPLLARLPALPGWRIGHFTRRIPDGYLEARRTGLNVLTDQSERELYEVVTTQTQAPIFSSARLRAVWRLHTGASR